MIQGTQCGQHLQCGNDAVAGIVFVHAQDVTGSFASHQPIALMQLFQYVAVAHFGTSKVYALLFQRNFHRHIGHHGANHAADFNAFFGARFGNHVNQAVAVVNFTIFVDHHQAVAVSIECDTVIGIVLQYSGL